MWLDLNGRRLGVWIKHKHDPEPQLVAVTEAHVQNENGSLLGYGEARCLRPDNFSRRKGVQMALARALKDANLSKDERRVVWEKVWHGKFQ